MRKTLIIISSSLLFLLFSCDDIGRSYPPTWRGFTYEPSTVHPGDSVLITAVQAKKGHYLNATTYSFSMTVYVDADGETEEQTLSYSYSTNYDGKDNGDPTWKVKIPDNAIEYNCPGTFDASWSNSSDGEGGTYSCVGGEGCTGSIASYSYTLVSNAHGTFTLQIRQ